MATHDPRIINRSEIATYIAIPDDAYPNGRTIAWARPLVAGSPRWEVRVLAGPEQGRTTEHDTRVQAETALDAATTWTLKPQLKEAS